MANFANRELPASYAAGMKYFDRLATDKEWFKTHEGKYVAILDNEVIAVTAEQRALTRIMGELYPGVPLYMPHVVGLSNHLQALEETLPEHYFQASSYYRKVLRQDSQWVKDHLHSHVAIIGRQVVGEANTFSTLTRNIRPIYGSGFIYMTEVQSSYPRVASNISYQAIFPGQR